MSYQGERGSFTPRLPDPGWRPDPSRMDIERYWDGRSWTHRTRDRVSKLERVAAPTYVPANTRPRRRTRPWAKWALTVILVGAVVFAVESYRGQLPEWVPNADVLARPQPQPVPVEYPVFGSSDLVTYLASNMVAQRKDIDVSYWLQNAGLSRDDILDALGEAATQNPYVFASSWQLSTKGTLVPSYTYDPETAESKRYLTSKAVEQALQDPAIAGATTDADRVAAIHDYIAKAATYDYVSFDAINAGGRVESSPLVAQSQEAYGILVAHTAVCNGYAQAFELLAHAAGLESVIVTGTATGLTTGGHAWNQVLVDGKWRVVDVTWDDDDVNEVVHTDYLMISPNDPALASRTMDLDWIVDANVGEYGI